MAALLVFKVEVVGWPRDGASVAVVILGPPETKCIWDAELTPDRRLLCISGRRSWLTFNLSALRCRLVSLLSMLVANRM